MPLDPHGAGPVTDRTCERKTEAAHIFRAAAADSPPHRPALELEKTVVVVEAYERRRRKGQDFGRRRRPDGAGHRHDVMVAEGVAIAARRQIFAEAQVILVDAACVARRAPVEPRQIRQHAPEPVADDIGWLAEETDEIVAGVLNLPLVQGDREGHLGRLRLDVERFEEFDKIGIGSRIVDDETGIDGDLALGDRRKDRVRMAADPVRLLVDNDVMAPAQEPSRGEPCNARPHDSNAKTRS
jgi:hypothetical protein